MDIYNSSNTAIDPDYINQLRILHQPKCKTCIGIFWQAVYIRPLACRLEPLSGLLSEYPNYFKGYIKGYPETYRSIIF